ncbi:MAG: N-6 DNA methylase [Oscillospiraceae bacterium]|nr:N-6 DNA methylase [Oscillospiraceae bacterium]
MEIIENVQIVCPIRGQLKVNKRSKDGLSATEEFYRVEAIKYLLSKGYPKENFWIEPIIKRFGNSGRNSFRSDFAVLDVPSATIGNSEPDTILSHAILICEVKRDNKKNEYVKNTQVKPMLDFAIKQSTMGLYWDNIEKRVFWIEIENGVKEIREGPISYVPKYGFPIETTPLTFNTISPVDSLIDTFDRIEDVLHQASFSPEQRYEIILQLLLAKIFDEHAFEVRGDEPLEIQDYKSLGASPETAKKKVADVVKRAVAFYGKHLPNKLSNTLPLSGDTLFEILKILAPIKIIHSKRDVVQTFYMKFAKALYKWDMAQYFTPTTVTDFLVDIINPQFGEHIADPACGSADFLVAAFRKARLFNPGFADCIWGIDNSSNAVQVAVLNMLLNGDGKTNIIKDDSLQNIGKYLEKYDVLTCNPPFGTKIVEKRASVLSQFDLGFEWIENEQGKLIKTDSLLTQQETGILFVEVCVKECRPGGRIAIILPNGYLGNRSLKYKVVREWILRHTRLAAIVSLPRFTFKSSGADVSASVLYLEKREFPLEDYSEDSYQFAVELIEKVGWDAGNKKAAPIYKRNQEDGSLIIGENGEPIIDCDFEEAVNRIVASDAANCFEWLAKGRDSSSSTEGWSVSIENVYRDVDITLDPKRYAKKVVRLRNSLLGKPQFLLGELVDFIPERQNIHGKKVSVRKSELYQYVEIQDIGFGDFHSKELRGWELPSRAKHFSETGDIYIGSIWGSAVKWCYIPMGLSNVVVTNGCFRCRIKPNMEEYLPDLLSYFNSEGWGVQMRALSRGSDGLAEICEEDAKNVIVPLLSDEVRAELSEYVHKLQQGTTTLNTVVKQKIRESQVPYGDPPKRPSHIVLV